MQVKEKHGSRKAVIRSQVRGLAVSISVRELNYLIAGKQVNTRGVSKKALIPTGERKRFAQAYNMEGAA